MNVDKERKDFADQFGLQQELVNIISAFNTACEEDPDFYKNLEETSSFIAEVNAIQEESKQNLTPTDVMEYVKLCPNLMKALSYWAINNL